MPAPIPVTIPVVGSIVATDDGALVHVPVAGVLPSVIVNPAHTLSGPVTGVGSAFTSTGYVDTHCPAGNVYVTIVVPADRPVSTPLTGSMVPKLVGALLQVPPVVGATDNGMVYSAQTDEGPVMGAGEGLTVSVVVMRQPVYCNVYVIVTVPADTPATASVSEPVAVPPAPVILAIVGSLLLQIPGTVSVVDVSPSVVVKPTHTLSAPVMAAGNGLMVTEDVTKEIY